MYNKKRTLIFITLFCVIFVSAGLIKRQINKINYNKALNFLSEDNYDSALNSLKNLDNYKDANSLIKEANEGKQYQLALKFINEKKYEEAINILNNIKDFKYSESKLKETNYQIAIQYYNNEEYNKAKLLFEDLKDYKESEKYLDEIDIKNIEQLRKNIYEKACNLFQEEQYSEALEKFNSILEYNNSEEYAKECELRLKRSNLNNVISSGIRCFVGITNDNKAIGKTYTDYEQCNLNNWENVISIDTFSCITIGLFESGQVKVSGFYDNNKKIDTTQWKNIIDIAAGDQFVVGLTKDGTVVGDGLNQKGQYKFENCENEKIIAIDAGWEFSVGLTEDRKLLFSGNCEEQKKDFNEHYKDWKDVINISAAGGEPTEKKRGSGHTVGLKSDGTVVAVGDNTWGQCNVSTWENIVKVSAGDWYTVGLTEDGIVLITDENRKGTRYIDEEKLEEINEKKDVIDIAAGYGQTFFLHSDGHVSTFGFDDFNEISTWDMFIP